VKRRGAGYPEEMNWSALAALLLAAAVMLGAFGAHGLRSRLDAYSMGVYEKAVFYHFVHALGILIVSLLPKLQALTPTAAARVCAAMLAGILLFSGSLYALAALGMRSLGMITPIGGVAFIGAWLGLAIALFRR
jgi:uncharacterized membrane protein YgdD (TMEM256/DUF423 family)